MMELEQLRRDRRLECRVVIRQVGELVRARHGSVLPPRVFAPTAARVIPAVFTLPPAAPRDRLGSRGARGAAPIPSRGPTQTWISQEFGGAQAGVSAEPATPSGAYDSANRRSPASIASSRWIDRSATLTWSSSTPAPFTPSSSMM